ncbi:hypothetical protein AB0H73_38365 [Streptomyces olivoreticuli]
MTDQSWQLRQRDRLIGTLALEGIDMFWTDCRFEPAPGWEELRPLFTASRDAWRQGDREAALATDQAIRAEGLTLVPTKDGPPLTDFLIRIEGNEARFRH